MSWCLLIKAQFLIQKFVLKLLTHFSGENKDHVASIFFLAFKI